MKNESLVEHSAKLGERLHWEMKELQDHPNVGNIRGKGLLLGIELVEDKDTKAPAKPDILGKVIGFCKSKGVLIGKNGDTVAGFNNVLTLAPPLCLTENDFSFMVKTLKDAIRTL